MLIECPECGSGDVECASADYHLWECLECKHEFIVRSRSLRHYTGTVSGDYGETWSQVYPDTYRPVRTKLTRLSTEGDYRD